MKSSKLTITFNTNPGFAVPVSYWDETKGFRRVQLMQAFWDAFKKTFGAVSEFYHVEIRTEETDGEGR